MLPADGDVAATADAALTASDASDSPAAPVPAGALIAKAGRMGHLLELWMAQEHVEPVVEELVLSMVTALSSLPPPPPEPEPEPTATATAEAQPSSASASGGTSGADGGDTAYTGDMDEATAQLIAALAAADEAESEDERLVDEEDHEDRR